MATLFKIKHRVMLKNGNYTAECRGQTIKMIFENPKVAKQTLEMMKVDNCQVEMPSENIIIQTITGFEEGEIITACREALDTKAKSKSWLSKFSYTEEVIQ